MHSKRTTNVALPFQHVDVDHLEVFLVRKVMEGGFTGGAQKPPFLACTATLKSLYLKVELSLFILQ